MVLLSLHVLSHSSNEQVGVEVEAVCAARTLALDVRLVVHAEHGVAAVACHHQLMPAALIDLYFADQGACARTCVEPDKRRHTKYVRLT